MRGQNMQEPLLRCFFVGKSHVFRRTVFLPPGGCRPGGARRGSDRSRAGGEPDGGADSITFTVAEGIFSVKIEPRYPMAVPLPLLFLHRSREGYERWASGIGLPKGKFMAFPIVPSPEINLYAFATGGEGAAMPRLFNRRARACSPSAANIQTPPKAPERPADCFGTLKHHRLGLPVKCVETPFKSV